MLQPGVNSNYDWDDTSRNDVARVVRFIVTIRSETTEGKRIESNARIGVGYIT